VASACGPTPTVIAEPSSGVTPILRLVTGARHSLTLTMYELRDQQVEQALVAAHARGVTVRVLLDKGYYGHGYNENRAAYSYLQGHGVSVRYAATYFAYTHQKTLTADGSVAAIMTLNFDGLYPSTRDYAVIDRRATDVKAILTVFNADWSHEQLASPPTAGGDLVFSPHAAASFTALVTGARSSIELESEELAYKPAIIDLCAAARRHVKVRIVMTYEHEWLAALRSLARCGAGVRVYHGQSYYIHAKLLLVDGHRALVGSQNLTTTSLDYNRELSIRLTAAAPLRSLAADFKGDYSGGERLP
jgi:cardiolipin synthase